MMRTPSDRAALTFTELVSSREFGDSNARHPSTVNPICETDHTAERLERSSLSFNLFVDHAAASPGFELRGTAPQQCRAGFSGDETSESVAPFTAQSDGPIDLSAENQHERCQVDEEQRRHDTGEPAVVAGVVGKVRYIV